MVERPQPDSEFTFIQKMINFFRSCFPNLEVYQAHSQKTYPASPCIVVQVVDEMPYTAHWGGIEAYDKETGKVAYGHYATCAFQVHCISGLSFDEADRVANEAVIALRGARSHPEYREYQHENGFMSRVANIMKAPATADESVFRVVLTYKVEMQYMEWVPEPYVSGIVGEKKVAEDIEYPQLPPNAT